MPVTVLTGYLDVREKRRCLTGDSDPMKQLAKSWRSLIKEFGEVGIDF